MDIYINYQSVFQNPKGLPDKLKRYSSQRKLFELSFCRVEKLEAIVSFS